MKRFFLVLSLEFHDDDDVLIVSCLIEQRGFHLIELWAKNLRHNQHVDARLRGWRCSANICWKISETSLRISGIPLGSLVKTLVSSIEEYQLHLMPGTGKC